MILIISSVVLVIGILLFGHGANKDPAPSDSMMGIGFGLILLSIIIGFLVFGLFVTVSNQYEFINNCIIEKNINSVVIIANNRSRLITDPILIKSITGNEEIYKYIEKNSYGGIIEEKIVIKIGNKYY